MNPIPQAPQPTHVEDVENTIIIHESNKTVRFKLDLSIENKPKTNWSRRKAKRYHAKVKNQAVELINEIRIQRKVERKRAKQRDSEQPGNGLGCHIHGDTHQRCPTRERTSYQIYESFLQCKWYHLQSKQPSRIEVQSTGAGK